MINPNKQSADINRLDNGFEIIGELSFYNVMAVYHQSLQQFSDCEQCVIDFSPVTASNSAGLALMIEWIKFAKSQQKSIHFKNVPNDLIAIAKVSGMEKMLADYV